MVSVFEESPVGFMEFNVKILEIILQLFFKFKCLRQVHKACSWDRVFTHCLALKCYSRDAYCR